MPLIFKKISPKSCLGVWHIEEPETTLKSISGVEPAEFACIDTWKSESRRKQWLACRVLIKQLLQLPSVKVQYDEYGKPSLMGFKGYISLSHTMNYAAVLINDETPAGIDIEKISPRIERVADRFLQVGEMEHIRKVAENYRDDRNEHVGRDAGYGMQDKSVMAGDEGRCHPQTELLYLYWCAKEALYKYYGKPVVDLKNDIYISPFDYFCSSQGTFAACVNTPEGVENHELQFERIGDHMLVYTLS